MKPDTPASAKSSFSGSRGSRTSRPSYSVFRDVEFQAFLRQSQLDYPSWWTRERICGWLRSLPEQTTWNCFICVSVLLAITLVVIDFKSSPASKYLYVLDVAYNVAYAVHVAANAYDVFIVMENVDVDMFTKVGFLIDLASFLHYAIVMGNYQLFKCFCYYLRLHRPFKYLWALNDYNLKGSILGTTLKYCYIFFVLRLTWAAIWTYVDQLEKSSAMESDQLLSDLQQKQIEAMSTKDWSTWYANSAASLFFNAIYIVNKMFIPIGPSEAPSNDVERIACLLVMMTGCLVVTGAAVASLSLVISIYMRPEEAFRARYRLILQEMKDSNIPPSLQDKVETFYKMYWHKQRAVSATQLLPTYPPTLPATVYTDIYFEATQKSRILCDLSNQFLSEVAKKMQTIHYIPGDTIIKRKSRKSSIIYIAYGDIEMLSAEDDITAMVRMTRGTAVAGCAGNAAVACARAHAAIRAATFCTAHALLAPDLWRIAVKYGRGDAEQMDIMIASFSEHLEKVKKHYSKKVPEDVKYKSSILHFKRNLMALKELKDANGKLLLKRTDVFLEIAGSYIMRNRADGSQSDEADAICLRSTFPCILQPKSSLQTAWHSLMCFIIVIVCFTHPYYLVFMKNVPLGFRFFDYVVTVIYAVDLIVHLSTGANVEDGVPITFAQTSSQQMRSQWFIMDVVGTLPIFEFVGDGHFAGINKLVRLPKVFRLLKSMEEMSVYHSNVLRFMSYTLLLLIACYLIASLQQGFMCFQVGYCLVTNFTHSPYWNSSTLDEETVQHRLTFALYWAISMITFTTHMETWGMARLESALYTMLVLEICVVLHIFIEAVYSATIMVTTALREDYDSCIANVKDFLIRNEVDPLLRQRFITYLQLCWYTDKAYSMTNKKSSIFYDLPPHVHQDIVTRQRNKYLLSIPFMKLLNREDLKDVSSKAKLFYTSPNEILLNTGDISNEMYLIKQGICEIIDPDTKEVMGALGVKNHFGVLECLLRLPAYYTVRAVTHVQVFSIAKKVLQKAMMMPQIRDAIEFAKEQPEYSRLCTRRESFLRYVKPTPAPNREKFQLPRKYEEDYAFLHPFYRLGFFSSLRYIFPRFTLRPDGQYLVRYEWVRAACALFSAMLFPSYTYLVLQWPVLYFVSLLLDLTAYCDIVQRMLVGYYNQQGLLIYHPASTAAHYLKSAFLIDVFACLPMENLESPLKESFENKYRLTLSRQVLMLNRLLQLYRLPGAMYNIGAYIERRDIILVLKAIPLFMALLNVLTCFMVFNSVSIFSVEDSDIWVIVPLADHGGSWLNHFNDTFRFNMTETPWDLHLATYFWVVYETTTTGYNSFNPSNFELMNILFIGMVIGAMITTYFSVRIISIRANVNKELAAYQEHMKDISHYMHREKLEPDLQKEVMEYYEYNWERMGGVDYTSVLKLCDQITLRTDAILHLYGPTFAKCPFLSDCDVSLVRVLGRAVRSAYFLRGMQMVGKDDVIAYIYFVDQGSVAVRKTVGDVSTSVRLYRGSVFGNLDKLATVRCPASIVAMARVHALQINAIAFHQIIADFPQVANSFRKLRADNESFIAGSKEARFQERKSYSEFSPRRGLIRHLYFKDKYFQMYLITVSLACMYADLYNAGFQCNSMLIVLVLYGLDMGFYVKILRQYMSPHIITKEHLKEILLPARKAYFQKDFKYDLMSCLPLELLSLTWGRHRWMAFSLLRLNRLLRISTVYQCLKRHNSRITVNLTLSTVFTVFVWFTLFVHTAACLWYFISLVEDSAKPKSSWIHDDSGESFCESVYICSLYFVLTTFTQNGVGDIMPKNYAEVMFVSLLQIISTLVYMVYVGEFSNIIQFQSFRSFSFFSKYLELQEFLKNNRVSKNLVTVVHRYTLHLWRESRGMQVPHFLKNAPQSLKLRIMSAAYIQHLNDNPVFEECEPAFLRQLVGCLQLFTYNEGMYVVKKNEITDAMYLIHTGEVTESSPDEGDKRTCMPGECFGVEQGLVYDTPFTYSYRTLVKSQVLTLHLMDWEYLLEHFPKSADVIYKYIKRDDDFPPKPRGTDSHGHQYSMDSQSRHYNSQSGMSSHKLGRSRSTPFLPTTIMNRRISPNARPTESSSSPEFAVPLTEFPTSTTALRPDINTPPHSITYGKEATDLKELASDLPLVNVSEPKTAEHGKVKAVSISIPESLATEIPLEPADPQLQPSADAEPSILENILQTILKTVLPTLGSTQPPTTAPETTQLTANSTEPIASQPYSAHSLKITELPPSLTQPEGTESKSKTDVRQEATQKAPLISLLPDAENTTDLLPESSYIFKTSIPMAENVDLSADNDLTNVPSEDLQFVWPINSRTSTSKYRFRDSSLGKKSDLTASKSNRSLPSQQSLDEETKNRRGPRDVEEALKDSSTFIRKMENRAKKLFGRGSDESEMVFGSDGSSDKDTLLIEEGEAATSALLHKIKKEGRGQNIEKSGTENDRDIQPTQEESRTKLSRGKILKSVNDEKLGKDPDVESTDRPLKSFEKSKEEPSTSSRVRRTVHYEEQNLTNEHQITKSHSTQSIRSLDIKDQDSETSLFLPLPSTKGEKPSSEEKKDEDKKE